MGIANRDWGYPTRLIRRLLGVAEDARWFDIPSTLRTQPVPDGSFSPVKEPPEAASNHLSQLAVGASGRPFLKWWHYFDAYDSRLRDLADRSRAGLLDAPVRILEIGVWKGGSLDVWREYFGPTAVIFGIDIDPTILDLEITSAEVRVGSQIDRNFLVSVVAEMGGLDVVIDDGSHLCTDVITSLQVLFPHLSEGGLYCIEDLHTSYWPQWGGGLRRRGSSVEVLKGLIDALHQPYFRRQAGDHQIGIGHANLTSIQFFDSVAILQKGANHSPRPFHGGGQ